MNLERMKRFMANVAGTALISFLISIGGTFYTAYEIRELKALIHETNEVSDVAQDDPLLETVSCVEKELQSLKLEISDLKSQDLYHYIKIMDLQCRLDKHDEILTASELDTKL